MHNSYTVAVLLLLPLGVMEKSRVVMVMLVDTADTDARSVPKEVLLRRKRNIILAVCVYVYVCVGKGEVFVSVCVCCVCAVCMYSMRVCCVGGEGGGAGGDSCFQDGSQKRNQEISSSSRRGRNQQQPASQLIYTNYFVRTIRSV